MVTTGLKCIEHAVNVDSVSGQSVRGEAVTFFFLVFGHRKSSARILNFLFLFLITWQAEFCFCLQVRVEVRLVKGNNGLLLSE